MRWIFCASILLAGLIALAARAAEADQAGLIYIKRDSRAATRQASLEAMRESAEAIEQSDWSSLPRTADRSLPKSHPRGAIDLNQSVPLAAGETGAWISRTDLRDGAWHTLEGDVGWLHRTAVAKRNLTATMILGVDQFAKVYVNGIDQQSFSTTANMEEGLSRFRVPLRAGTNHLLILVGDTPMKFRSALSPVSWEIERALEERLDEDFSEFTEARYYRIETVPVPADLVLEVGGLAFDRDGTLAVATRRGEIWHWRDGQWKRWASGLHEPLGLIIPDPGRTIVLQRPELTMVSDTDGDGVADMFRTLLDAWSLSGGHHEYMFGPVLDSKGNIWGVTSGLCDPTRASYCGWCFRLSRDGEFTPWCTGFRSPNGIVVTPEDEIFIADNQGEWVGTSPLYHVQRDAFYGHPVGLRWDPKYQGDPNRPDVAALEAMRKPAAILFPYGAMGHSLSQPLVDTTSGGFGVFAGQMFIGDQSKCNLMRVSLEKVDGEYQGACVAFRSGFQSGNNRLAFAPDGSLYVGQTDRGWGSIGGRPYGLQRVVWTREIPMELETVTLRPNGFQIRFTKAVDKATAGEAGRYAMQHYRYRYHAAYGSPVVDRTPAAVTAVNVSDDGRHVLLEVPELVTGRIYELNVKGVRAQDGTPLLHDTAYYTLNRLRP